MEEELKQLESIVDEFDDLLSDELFPFSAQEFERAEFLAVRLQKILADARARPMH